ncbi:A-kinase anchor protein 11 [Cheilinus undulatus]|uniref:A-kinase anchor protein 11 n=1 Tax=Cheilinus undulatus TaxID=241271 RepID=UPI001BD3DDA2|nr:A-kinase anchor protein 11 [Cheilinus undulatus]
MQEVSADPRVPKGDHGNFGRSESPKTSHQNNAVLEKFAQNMTKSIIQSFLSQMEMVEPEGMARFNQNQEMLAEELASSVVQEALREVCGDQNILEKMESDEDGRQATFLDQSKNKFLENDPKIDPNKEFQTSEGIQPHNPSFSQSGLPLLGSIDYPDAPPTTPLLPELERSRYSFAKKLKGGLAKVFMPSPPPPTPKEEEDGANNDPRVELMEQLMQSLSTDDLAREYLEVGGDHGARIEAYAEALSCGILDSVLYLKNRDQITENNDLHLLAHQLAETIIASSLDEVRMIV